jgi:hypothetical protein
MLGLEMEVDVLILDANENVLLAGVPTTLEWSRGRIEIGVDGEYSVATA